jgi:hypothetical protein
VQGVPVDVPDTGTAGVHIVCPVAPREVPVTVTGFTTAPCSWTASQYATAKVLLADSPDQVSVTLDWVAETGSYAVTEA